MQTYQNSNPTRAYPSIAFAPAIYQPQQQPLITKQPDTGTIEAQLKLTPDKIHTLEMEREYRIRRRQCTPCKCITALVILLIFVAIGGIIYYLMKPKHK